MTDGYQAKKSRCLSRQLAGENPPAIGTEAIVHKRFSGGTAGEIFFAKQVRRDWFLFPSCYFPNPPEKSADRLGFGRPLLLFSCLTGEAGTSAPDRSMPKPETS